MMRELSGNVALNTTKLACTKVGVTPTRTSHDFSFLQVCDAKSYLDSLLRIPAHIIN